MNKLNYRVIFSKYLGQLVAVGENACAHAKGASGARSSRGSMAFPNRSDKVSSSHWSAGLMRDVSLGLMALCGMTAVAHASAPDHALPSGAAVQRGGVTHSVNEAGNTMTIHQTTSRAVVNYQGFNVGKSATVNHTGGLLLGRVTGVEASRIDGTINTSGMVLVNPNGIAIGGTGNINAGSFTASTFNVSDDNFLAGKLHFERNGSNAGVVNHGQITTTGGGYVALVGASVNNHGAIQTQSGDVALVASDETVTLAPEAKDLKVQLSSRVSLELNAKALNAHVANHQDGVIVTEGGQVLMRAAAMLDAVSGVAQAQVHHAGRIDTSAEQGGRVDVLADHGLVRVSGSINTNSTRPVLLASASPVGGDIFIGRDDQTHVLALVGDVRGAQFESKGGFVETSGHHLVTDGVRVTAKDWLLDPTDVEIVAAGSQLSNGSFVNQDGTSTFLPTPSGTSTHPSSISIETINAALNGGTNVTIQTVSGNNQEGKITVSAVIEKKTTTNANANNAPKLTLDAAGRILINQNIQLVADASGAKGNLDVELKTANGGVVIKDGVKIDLNQGILNAAITTKGADTGFAVGAGATINAKQVNIHTNTIQGAGLVLTKDSAIKVSEGLSITAESTNDAGGHIEVLGKITNTGTGDIVLAAGSNRLAGDGKGGQVKTATGQAIDTKGNVYIYTGNADDTGKLSDLVGSLDELRLSDIGAAKQNADTNRKFEDANRLNNGTTAQVYFRDKVNLNLRHPKLNDTITYGDDTSTAFGTAKLTATLNDTYQHSTKLNAGDFKIALKAVVASLNATEVTSAVNALKAEANVSTSKNLKAGVYGNKSEAPLNLGSNKYGGIRGELEVLRKNLTISGVKVNDKTYDGNTSATVDTSATLNFDGLVKDDVIQVGNLSATFVDKNVGTNKDVNLGEASIEGADKLNYNIVTPQKTTASITKSTDKVVLRGEKKSLEYNGQTQTLTGLTAEGLKGADTVADYNLTATTSGKDAGTYTNTVFSSLEDVLKNYLTVEKENGELTIGKSKSVVSITGASDTRQYNGTTQILSGLKEVLGLLGDDKVNNGGVTARASGRNVGDYETVFANIENLRKNYETVNTKPGLLKIERNTTATVSVTGASGSTVFTGNTQNVTGVTTTGLLGEDQGNNGGVNSTISGVQVGVYKSVFTGLQQLQVNYANVNAVSGTLTINAVSPPLPEPQNPATPVGYNSGRTSVRLADANPFNLAGLGDEPVCSVDNLSACYCEKALDEEEQPLERLNVCMPEKPKDTGRAKKAA